MKMADSLLRRIFFSIYSYAVMYAMFGVLSLSYHACFNSSLSTMEKRYHFSSSTGGLIMITDNIANILTNLFIGHYGKTAHKPRWMAIGCTVTGISVMITSLPYFIYGPAQEADLEFAKNMTLVREKMKLQNDQMCLTQPIEEDCSIDSATDKYTMTLVAVSCFAISNFFRGFGTSIYFTYGTPYLDDNISKAKMPTFFGFIFAARILGAPLGFVMSSSFLKFYENPFAVPNDLTVNDPRWIGAWWIGFLISGFLMVILAIPLSFFPREFKKKPKKSRGGYVISSGESYLLQNRSSENPSAPIQSTDDENNKKMVDIATVESPTGYGFVSMVNNEIKEEKKPKQVEDLSLRELPGEIWQIISNPLIICQMLGNMFRGIGIAGYFVFQTKFLEANFRESASKASLTSGTTGFAGKVSGIILGGAIISLFRPGPRKLTTFIFIVECTSIFALLYGATIQGPQYAYPNTIVKPNNQLELINFCNKNCYCDHLRYQPVCEPTDMKAYFSPCHAGCRNSFKTQDESTTFTECDCADTPSKTLEKCPKDTTNLMKYAYIIAIGSMISGSGRAGNMVTFFRSINPDQKPLAVAVIGFWHSLVVSIPYPILYGRIFDYCCLVWNKECNKRGNCWLYDTDKLRHIYHGVSIVLVVLGSMFDCVMIYLSPRLGNLYDDDDDENQGTWKDRVMFWKKKERLNIVSQDENKTETGNGLSSGANKKKTNSSGQLVTVL